MSAPLTTGVPEHLRLRTYCCGRVNADPRSVRFVNCSRRATVERDGKPYCAQHDPVAVERRRAQSDARHKLKMAPLLRDDRRLEDYHRLVLALRKVCVPRPSAVALAEARELLRRIDVYEEDGR